jgi:hypothetical protein
VAKPGGRWTPGNGPPTKWKQGQSGNPSGRKPSVEHIHALARQHCPEAIAGLVEFMRQREDPQLAKDAMIALLDRGVGRPPQTVFAQIQTQVVTGGIDSPPKESLAQWIERRRRELSALDGPPTVEHVVPQPSPPNGEHAAANAPSARPASAAPQSAPLAERSEPAASTEGPQRRATTESEADWLRDQRRRLNIDPNRERDD